MVNCRKTNNLISAYIDGELPGVEQHMVREHLQQCNECRKEYEELLSMKRALSGMKMQSPSPNFQNQLLAKIHNEGSQTKGVPTWQDTFLPQRRLWLGVSFVGLTLIALLAFSKDPNEIRWTSTLNEPKLATAPSAIQQDVPFYSPTRSYAAPVANSYMHYTEPAPLRDVPSLSPNDNPRVHPRTPNTERP